MSEIGSSNYYVNFTDILEYVGNNIGHYKKGEQVFNANHILLCGVINKNACNKENIEIFALCLKSSALYDHPYEVVVKLNKNQISCQCKCPAGNLGLCKHCIAVLFYLNRIPRDLIEDVTCTDIKQQWGKLKSSAHEMYAAVPLRTFCHFNASNELLIEKYCKPNLEMETFYETITKDLGDNVEFVKVKQMYRTQPQVTNNDNEKKTQIQRRDEILSIINSSINGFSALELLDIPSVLMSNIQKDFYEQNILVSNEEAIQLCLDTLHQCNELWHKSRKIRITASAAYELFTYNKQNHSEAEWTNKINKMLDSNFKGTGDTKHGLLCEERAIKLYESAMNNKIMLLGLLINPRLPWLGASPDGIVPSKYLIEIKSPKEGKSSTASEVVFKLSYLEFNIDEGTVYLKKKHKYFCQVQLGMFITNLKKCHFLIYCSFDNSIYCIEVEYDEKVVMLEYLPSLKEVFFKYLLKNISQRNKENIL